MLNFQDIKDGLFEVVDAVFPMQQIVWLFENSPRPQDPFIGLRVTNIDFIGQDYQTVLNSDGLFTLNSQRVLTLEMNFYNHANNFGHAEFFVAHLRLAPIIELLAKNNLGFIDKVSLTDITELLDTKYEKRAILELRFSYQGQGKTPTKFGVGYYDTVEPIQIEG